LVESRDSKNLQTLAKEKRKEHWRERVAQTDDNLLLQRPSGMNLA